MIELSPVSVDLQYIQSLNLLNSEYEAIILEVLSLLGSIPLQTSIGNNCLVEANSRCAANLLSSQFTFMNGISFCVGVNRAKCVQMTVF